MAQLNLFGQEATQMVQEIFSRKSKKSKGELEYEQHIKNGGNPKVVILREEEYGYVVLNQNDFKFFPSKALILQWGFKVMKNYNQTKEDFIREVMACYEVNEVKWTRELKDEDGSFMLDGIEVKYKFRTDFFSQDGKPSNFPAPHLEFRTDVPTIISETGYRSEFLNFDYNYYDSVKEIIDIFIEEYRRGE